MKKFILIGLALCLSLGAMAKSPKRGVSENQFSMGSMLEALEPGVTWYYNWGNTPGKGFNNEVIDFEGIEFVPMCWNANYNAEAIREYCKTHPQTKYILGFNEPNFTAQANMTPQKAAEAWPAVQALAKELGLKIVAPALNYSPNPPYTDPLKWMDEFVALVGLDAFDYTAVHNYGGIGVMKTIAGNFHQRYGKDVWVTEFCYWPNEGNNNDYVSPETQIGEMAEALQWLETTPWIFRYAWFKAIGNSNSNKGPNYGLLQHEGSSSDPWTLSPQGKVYVGLGDFNPEVWHPTGQEVSAIDFVENSLSGLGVSEDASSPSGVDVTRFNSGAALTWQFNVPQPGYYNVTLKVAGFGEPTRFDPKVQWALVEGDKETPLSDVLDIALPNSDSQYVDYRSAVQLPAGNVKLRLKDTAPYQPSGLKISTIRLDYAAGVEDIISEGFASDAAIYNLQGICLGKGEGAWQSLPKGIYIVDGKKVAK